MHIWQTPHRSSRAWQAYGLGLAGAVVLTSATIGAHAAWGRDDVAKKKVAPSQEPEASSRTRNTIPFCVSGASGRCPATATSPKGKTAGAQSTEDALRVVNVPCAEQGQLVVSGGATPEDPSAASELFLNFSGPDAQEMRWLIGMTNAGPEAVTGTAWAICMPGEQAPTPQAPPASP